jgi:uncharacterized membrane protein
MTTTEFVHDADCAAGSPATDPAAVPASAKTSRLVSIDAVRGLIMLFMAMDHVGLLIVRRHSAEYWGGLWTRYGGSDHVQFLIRLLSDLCAPGFFLWMGSGIALLAAQRASDGWSTSAITRFLALRGLLLIAIGQAIETPAWVIGLYGSASALTAEPVPGGGGAIYVDISVIFALGASMVLAGVLMAVVGRRSWLWLLLGVSLLAVSSALVPAASHAREMFSLWQRLLLVAGQTGLVLVEYPVLPWFALTCIGIALGQAMERHQTPRQRMSAVIGVGLICAALILRHTGAFGNIRLPRDDGWIEFFNLIKYPPSLVFSLLMVGGNLLLLSLFSGRNATQWKASRLLATFGRAPLFFYIAHLYLFALLGAMFFRQGTNYGTGVAIWGSALFPLYAVCAWFGRLKRASPGTSILRML